MRFYTRQHKHSCGIDLHARTMYLCVLDPTGAVLLHRNIPCDPVVFLDTIAPYRPPPPPPCPGAPPPRRGPSCSPATPPAPRSSFWTRSPPPAPPSSSPSSASSP